MPGLIFLAVLHRSIRDRRNHVLAGKAFNLLGKQCGLATVLWNCCRNTAAIFAVFTAAFGPSSRFCAPHSGIAAISHDLPLTSAPVSNNTSLRSPATIKSPDKEETMKSVSSGHVTPKSKSEQELVRRYERIGISAVAGALACEDRGDLRSDERKPDARRDERWHASA
jgi:hypothetical protein